MHTNSVRVRSVTFWLLCASFHFACDNSFLALRKKTKKERLLMLTCDSIWVMLNQIKDSDPSLLWIRSNFSVSFVMSNGQEMKLDFSINPAPRMYDAATIIADMPEAILVDIDKDFGEYLSVASTVANMINDKMKVVIKEVVEHCRCAFKIRCALRDDKLDKASLLVDWLIDQLQLHEPLAGDVWAQWLADVLDYIEVRVGM